MQACLPRSLLLIVLLFLAGCQVPAQLEDFGPVPDFSLTERSGRSVSKADLHGKVWIAACVFTRCTGSCPKITGVMARLHHELRDQPEVIFVSISVDPEHDTPEVLRDYADHQGADGQRWLFLTGPQDRVYELIQKGLLLTVMQRQGDERTPGNEVDHSPRLTLVDRRGHKRGTFDATDPLKVEELLKKLPALLQEKP
jgi:protein SCO1